ncbi:mitochondrial carrier domain-containing protein [Microdochium trichocladiopsis]|uniref:Mitochondrial thiamine pyrophosphate carrier 1 n=1 Tax=Microdochium trichocladiopsis TaxID=1682393 RepID=A0A9P8Y8X8_9PEZI|nr:mitochondrial carrier domain-containing protein [Microdochium trichocladiopsis]KAH7035164.1 mitochondrial carrier domain-containing protein [Microdochium trichocladiopsis]
MSQKAQRLQDEGTRTQVVAAGATAGLISRFVIAPLDVVKIRLQLQTHSLSDPLAAAATNNAAKGTSAPIYYKGTLRTLRHIVENEGIRALWKGNVPAELMYVSYAAVQFTMYRQTTLVLQRMNGDNAGGNNNHNTTSIRLPKAAQSFIAGATAGATATAATYPLDLLRTRFAAQVSSRAVYPSLRHAVLTIYRDEGGFRGFFRGLAPGLAGIVPYMGLFFAMYESARPVFGQLSSHSSVSSWLPPGVGDATAGVVASVVAKTGVFPLDTVRKRIQVQGPTRALYVHRDIPEYERGMWRTIRAIVAVEGFRGLYRGLVVSLCKAAPASAVTMWTYERALNLFIRYSGGQGTQVRALPS